VSRAADKAATVFRLPVGQLRAFAARFLRRDP